MGTCLFFPFLKKNNEVKIIVLLLNLSLSHFCHPDLDVMSSHCTFLNIHICIFLVGSFTSHFGICIRDFLITHQKVFFLTVRQMLSCLMLSLLASDYDLVFYFSCLVIILISIATVCTRDVQLHN